MIMVLAGCIVQRTGGYLEPHTRKGLDDINARFLDRNRSSAARRVFADLAKSLPSELQI
jgi:hypothetical protein